MMDFPAYMIFMPRGPEAGIPGARRNWSRPNLGIGTLGRSFMQRQLQSCASVAHALVHVPFLFSTVFFVALTANQPWYLLLLTRPANKQ